MDKILEVKDLKISFRTSGGTLKAVRDISFDLERGKTLAIVGESGSGKSVTSKAILGILAGNSIIEGGEILYDGKDLLKITEEEMCKIRGDRISMIFQDPLSSLNPIVKIGKQITEAMLLKNRGNRRNSRNDFNTTLALLRENMIASGTPAAKANEMCKTFDNFCIRAIKLENSYASARAAAEGLVADISDLLFMASKDQEVSLKERIAVVLDDMKKVKDAFLTHNYDAKISDTATKIRSAYSANSGKGRAKLGNLLVTALENAKALLDEILARPQPGFFRLGYYSLTHPNEDLASRDIVELNEAAEKYLRENFLGEFLVLAAKASKHSFEASLEKKRAVMPKLEEAHKFYLGSFDKAGAKKVCKEISTAIEGSIDRLEIVKDSTAYTFRSSLEAAIDQYFTAIKKNPKEEARYARQSAKRDRLIARGKKVDWKVVPKVVYDIDELKEGIASVIDRMTAKYSGVISTAGSVDFDARANEMITYFRDKASQVNYKVTKRMAREKAIKLMEEVGIPEPRTRYYQYPFEFSGGMRQRIVIAIALAANPDILICDEPTTALDVTIQAQILELINRLKAERGLSVIFITHDLGVVANMADEIAVMYAGKIVEYGTADDVFYDPQHPYTWALLSSMPDLETKEKLDAIPGTPPNMIYPPEGDAFADRNKYAMQIDFEMQPPKFEVSPTHWAATWLLHPDAPKIDPPKAVTDRIERMKKAGGEA